MKPPALGPAIRTNCRDSSVLVTGGAGYIGSHVALALSEANYSVIVVDDLSTGCHSAIPANANFVKGDVADQQLICTLLSRYSIKSVIHLAAEASITRSTIDPIQAYSINTSGTLELLRSCIECDVKHLVFSSTCAVYGVPKSNPVAETESTLPITSYARSKLASEWMMRDIADSRKLNCAILRYFNVAGSDPQGRALPSPRSSSSLLRVACEVAPGLRDNITVFGTDYETRDGTCIRDYIHVTDIAEAHVKALRALESSMSIDCDLVLNCGNGMGYSVLEILNTVESVSKRSLNIVNGERRKGDVPQLVADSSLIRKTLDWIPHFSKLEQIVRTALDAESKWNRNLS